MFAKTFKTLVSKPFARSTLKSTLFKTKPNKTSSLFKNSLFPASPFPNVFVGRSFCNSFKDPRKPDTVEQAQLISNQQKIVSMNPTLDTLVTADRSLNSYMSKIYRITGASITAGLGISYLFATTAALAMNPFAAIFGGFAVCLAGQFAMESIAPKSTIEKGFEVWKNPLSRKLAFSTVITGSAMIMSPLIKMALASNPAAIPMAAGIAILSMGCSSLYAMYQPIGKFSKWRSVLYGSLGGLIGMKLLALLSVYAVGPTVFSLACGRIDLVAGLVLFNLFQVYDTHNAVESFYEGKFDHLEHVVQFFLNFQNLMVRILRVLGDD